MDVKIIIKELDKLNNKALKENEVPISALIIKNDQIISKSYNKVNKTNNILNHAEIIAIKKASKRINNWRLNDCEMYVTLEPCPMCAGAIINARIARVFYGAYDSKAGSFGSLCDLSVIKYNSVPEIHGGILEDECKEILSTFFKDIR